MTAAPQSACSLAADLTAAGWRWKIGGHRNPEEDAWRVVGVDPTVPGDARGVQATWENGRLHSVVLWDSVTCETTLTAARELVNRR